MKFRPEPSRINAVRALVFLIFVAAVAAHRHSLPRRLIAALPSATEEARRRVGGTAGALWRAVFDPEWHDCR